MLSLRAFIQEVRRKNADVPIYIYGETKTSQHLPNDVLRELHGFIHMYEDTPEFMARHIIREAKSYLEGIQPPFFKALLDYAEDGSYSWHCPGHSGGVAFLKSPVGQMFHQFFGENMLRADVCNAVDELGQLLDHTGPVAASERNAARIFNADHCFFVTNGTSTSNKMVWHHTVAPGDVVVVDRNCHKSILHSIIMTGAIPVFMKPTRNHFGIIGPIPQSEFSPEAIKAKIRANPLLTGVDAEQVKPRILTLTQSTYDGVLYNTETIKNMLDGYVDALHFDEAWLPHAAFHPFYGCFHAMGKKRPRPEKSLVYATQSIHKLLAGISQASHVLVQDAQNQQAGPAPVQRGVPDAHLDQPAVRDHRQLRRGGRDDGAARRHGAGGGKHHRGAGLPPRHAQGRPGVRQGLVVQGLGPGQAGRGGHRPRRRLDHQGRGPHGQVAWLRQPGRRLQHAGPDQVHHRHARAGPERQVRQDRHSGLDRHRASWPSTAIIVEKTGPVQLLHHVHHRHHQGPLEHDADGAAAVQGRLRARTSRCGASCRSSAQQQPRYERMGLADLCQYVHELYAKYDIARLTTDMYLRDLTPAMKPSDAFAHIAHRKTERVEIDELEGRITTSLVTPYPPGIPLLIPGEVFNKKIVDYLKFSREFNEACPGFETDIHGLVEEVDESGKRRYYADCVRR